jgi:iron complex outermembrane receptor protein
VTLSGGNHETYDARVIGGRRIGELKIVGALEYLQTDRHDPLIEEDQQTRLDEFMGTRASLAPGHANTHRKEFGAQLNITGQNSSLGLRASTWRDIGMGAGAASSLDPFGSVDSTVLEATFKYRRDLAENWSFSGIANGSTLNYKMDDWHFFPPGAFGVFPDGVILNTEFDERSLRLQGDFGFAGFNNHYLTLGAGGELGKIELISESRNYNIDENGFIIPIGPVQDTTDTAPGLGDENISRELTFAYLQDEWTLHPDWVLTWGLRLDHYSDFGNTVNPRAVLVWNARHDLTAKLLYGRGFRAPSMLEQRAEHIPAIRGNADLDPEKLNSFEIAIDYRPRFDLRTRGNVFYHETDDQIRQQNDGGPEFTPENVGKQKGRGLELELWWDTTRRTSFYGYYAYQDNTDETTGKDAGYSPHHKAFAQLQSRHGDWFFNLQATYIGDRARVAEDPRPDPDTYTLVNFLGRYEFSKHLEASLNVRNVFDEDAEDAGFGTAFPGDMPLPGRTYYFSLIGRF